ncbi:hypothetical protein IP81_07475 [Novosphingobium sp. AAP83]|uniref:helix-turn-helix transcriptional regulator n=1 Tax=Novosphingobium sp. AAP83 TaxID=1523425 RepID=UPI0006B9E6E9|nr:WYL domain-containing protein [Novosphingobium sp. AAP83]KPF91897.1 hypothetical protein IP81_07475 [Novosphingobium sp. AAP83]
MSADQKLALTRRAFATGMTGSLAALGIGDVAAARSTQNDAADADLRDATLRGLARAGDLGDPVLASKADAVLARLESTDPEGAMLARVYRLFDVASAAYGYGSAERDQITSANLPALHTAIRDCRPVSFSYTDREGEVTSRTVQPLALVHPPQGIKLLAWCEKREDNRQFFVRAISDLTQQPRDFRNQRLALLQSLANSAAA